MSNLEPGPQGGGLFALAPEMTIRQMLILGLKELAGDRARLDELFRRRDEKLLQGTGARWLDELVNGYLRMTESHEGDGVRVLLGPPSPSVPLNWPVVAVVVEGSAEDASTAMVGDIVHVSAGLVGSEVEKWTTTGIDHVTNVQVQCWAAAPEEAVVLHSVVHHLLMREKGQLNDDGVVQMTLSASHLRPDPAYHPQHIMVPVVNVQLYHAVVQTRRERPAVSLLTVCTGVFSA